MNKEIELELHGCDDLPIEPLQLTCLLIGHSFISRLKKWLRTPSNPFHLGLGISNIFNYAWLEFPGGSIAANSDTIFNSSLLPVANIIVLDLAGNDLDEAELSEAGLINRLTQFISTLQQKAPAAVIICLQLLKRFDCRHKSVCTYNEEVVNINRECKILFTTTRSTSVWWWSHKGLWGCADVYDDDGVHLSCKPVSDATQDSGMLRYARSIRGAILCAKKAHY